MSAAAWICLLLPLGSTVLITLLGGAISRRTAGWISTLACGGAFVAAVVAFCDMLGRSPDERSETLDRVDLARRRELLASASRSSPTRSRSS